MSEEVMNNVVVETPKKKRPKKKKSLARRIIEYVLLGIFGGFAIFVIAGNIQGEVKKSENYGQSIRFGIGSFIVLTDSMEPEIPKDSALITYKTDVNEIYSRFNAGETIDITFANINCGLNYAPKICEEWAAQGWNPQLVVANRVMTHRIVEMSIDENKQLGQGRYIFVTAGINIHTIDEETGEEVINYARAGQYQLFTEKEYLGEVKISNQFLGKVFNFIVSPIGLIIVLLVPAAYLIITSSIDIFKAMKASENEEVKVSGDTPSGSTLSSVSAKDRERLKKELLDEMIKKKKEKANEKQD